MSYSYTAGQGVAALVPTEPNGATEPVSNLDDAIRQIKAFLTDNSAGWPFLLTSISGVANLVSGVANLGNKNFFSAYSNANQVIPVTTYTKLTLGLEHADPDGVYDIATSRFTAPASGWYKITVSVRIDWLNIVSLDSGRFSLELKRNGTTVAEAEHNMGALADFVGATYSIERTVPMSAGDYLEVFGFYDLYTGTVDCQITADLNKTVFQGFRLL